MTKTNTTIKKLSRRTIMGALLDNEVKALTLAVLRDEMGDDITMEMLDTAMDKWNAALTKNTKKSNANDTTITDEIVPWVLSQDQPVSAADVNTAILGQPRANKASSMLRRAVEMGMLSRDKVRKTASFIYAAPDYDWDTYKADYDAKVAARRKTKSEDGEDTEE